MWSEGVEFTGYFTSHSTVYNLTQEMNWVVSNVGIGEKIRMSNTGTDAMIISNIKLNNINITFNPVVKLDNIISGQTCSTLIVDFIYLNYTIDQYKKELK